MNHVDLTPDTPISWNERITCACFWLAYAALTVWLLSHCWLMEMVS